jgi:hypothetical protein
MTLHVCFVLSLNPTVDFRVASTGNLNEQFRAILAYLQDLDYNYTYKFPKEVLLTTILSEEAKNI